MWFLIIIFKISLCKCRMIKIPGEKSKNKKMNFSIFQPTFTTFVWLELVQIASYLSWSWTWAGVSNNERMREGHKREEFYLFFVLIISGHDREELVSQHVNVVGGAQSNSSRSLHLGEGEPWDRNLTTNIIVKLNYLRGLPLLPQLFPAKFPLKWTILSLPWGKTTS